MRTHIVNPSDLSFGTAVITPRWLYVLAAATPERFGTPVIVDETLELQGGDVVLALIAFHVDLVLLGADEGPLIDIGMDLNVGVIAKL